MIEAFISSGKLIYLYNKFYCSYNSSSLRLSILSMILLNIKLKSNVYIKIPPFSLEIL